MLLRINMTGEPYEVSLLWALWYTKGAGGVHRMNALEGGAQVDFSIHFTRSNHPHGETNAISFFSNFII